MGDNFMTFEKRLLDLFELFGLRNAMYMRGDTRVLFLMDAIRYFGKLVRTGEKDKNIMGTAIASLFARTAAFADSFVNLPLADAMCEKYPDGICAYCQHKICVCDPNRKQQIVYGQISLTQKTWPVNDWLRHLDATYGKVNRDRGILFAHSRLYEEVGEVISAQLVDAHDQRLTLTDVRRNISREFADVFAWIFVIAALLEINLDEVLDLHYSGRHRRCGNRPCTCGPHFRYIQQDLLHIGGPSPNTVVVK